MSSILAPSIPLQRREEKDKFLILAGVGGGVLVSPMECVTLSLKSFQLLDNHDLRSGLILVLNLWQ